MRRIILFTIIIFVSSYLAHTQPILKPQVLSTSGNSGTSGNCHLSYTIGQPISFKGQVQNYLLTQGFQQPLGCQPNQEEEICFVTVDDVLLKNQVIWRKTYYKGTEVFIVLKEISSNVYDSIGYVQFDHPAIFTDINSNPEVSSSRYKIQVIDTCGNKSQPSTYHQTMLLQISQGGIPSTMILYWTFYVDESGSYVPSKYYIYRGTSPATMVLHDSISGSQNSYNDLNVFDVYYYRLAIHKNIGCDSLGNQTSSFSNIKDNIIVGVFENSVGTINIFPNPMTNTATLTIPNFNTMTTEPLQIMDITGKLVKSISISNVKVISDETEIVIERGDLKPGVYFVVLKADRTYRGKLIIE